MLLFFLKTKRLIPQKISLLLSPENFRDAFCIAGGAFGRPWLKECNKLVSLTEMAEKRQRGTAVVGSPRRRQSSADVCWQGDTMAAICVRRFVCSPVTGAHFWPWQTVKLNAVFSGVARLERAVYKDSKRPFFPTQGSSALPPSDGPACTARPIVTPLAVFTCLLFTFCLRCVTCWVLGTLVISMKNQTVDIEVLIYQNTQCISI